VQGILRDEKIRKSLDLTNWEAANKLVRDWEVETPKDVICGVHDFFEMA